MRMDILTRIASGYTMKTNEEHMLEDIRWLLSLVSSITEYRIDRQRIQDLKKKYG
jgi:hypothetical protein